MGAAVAVFLEMMKTEEGREIIGKIPIFGKITSLFGKSPELKALAEKVITPFTPEQSLVNALTVLSGLMPVGEASEKFKAAVSLILDGVSNLKASLAKEQP